MASTDPVRQYETPWAVLASAGPAGPMPGVGARLGEDAVKAMVAYVRSLGARTEKNQ